MLRIRNKSFGSCVGSGLKLVSDSDPDSNPDPNPDSNPDSNPYPNPGFGSRSETGQNFFFLVIKYLPSLIFKHKKTAFPQLHDLATNKLRNKFAGFGFGSISKRHGSADSDPYQKVTDPQHCVQLPVNVFYCTEIVATSCK